MTGNRMVVLLDVFLGFNESCHTGTPDDDLKRLVASDLIEEDDSGEDGFEWKVTEEGSKMVRLLQSILEGSSVVVGPPEGRSRIVVSFPVAVGAEKMVDTLSDGLKIVGNRFMGEYGHKAGARVEGVALASLTNLAAEVVKHREGEA